MSYDLYNGNSKGITYPRKYKIFLALTVVFVVLIFALIGVFCFVSENIDMLPEKFQNEVIILAVFIAVEVINAVLGGVCASKVNKIRVTTQDEYRRKRVARDILEDIE